MHVFARDLKPGDRFVWQDQPHLNGPRTVEIVRINEPQAIVGYRWIHREIGGALDLGDAYPVPLAPDNLVPQDKRDHYLTKPGYEVLRFNTEVQWTRACEDSKLMKAAIEATFRSYGDALRFAIEKACEAGIYKIVLR